MTRQLRVGEATIAITRRVLVQAPWKFLFFEEMPDGTMRMTVSSALAASVPDVVELEVSA